MDKILKSYRIHDDTSDVKLRGVTFMKPLNSFLSSLMTEYAAAAIKNTSPEV